MTLKIGDVVSVRSVVSFYYANNQRRILRRKIRPKEAIVVGFARRFLGVSQWEDDDIGYTFSNAGSVAIKLLRLRSNPWGSEFLAFSEKCEKR